MDVYLGLVSAETLRAYPRDAVERSMHGGVPSGAGQYHVNVSLFDAKTGAVIPDAQVEVEIDEVGMTSESKKLEPIVIHDTASYGNYFKLRGKTSYVIIVRVRKPDSSRSVEAKFEHKTS